METVHQTKRNATRLPSISLLISLFLLLLAGTCSASTITLAWDSQSAPDLAGYRVYYSDTNSTPFTGTGADQGASPISMSTQPSATITGLNAGKAYYFAITAVNTAGIETPYSTIVTVPELIPPTVSVAAPAPGASVSGTVSVSAEASDNDAVARVELYVDGALVSTVTSAPYLYSWNTSSLTAGAHTLAAKAYDRAGNLGESSTSAVTVVNDALAPTVALSVPGSDAALHGAVAVNASANDNTGVARLELYANGTLIYAGNQAPLSYSWNTALVANGSYTLTARAYDATGNVGESAALLVTVYNDTTAPLVAIAALENSATLAGVAQVSVGASDDVAVAKVEFYVNGALQATQTSSPYSFTWNTAQLTNGNYTLTARAYDAAGNVGQSAPQTVNVFNDSVAPLVSINLATTPTSATAQTIAGEVSDNGTLASVTVQVGSATPAAAQVSGSTWSFAVSGLVTGNNLITVTAYDLAGNSSSAITTIVVQTVTDTTTTTTEPLTIVDAQNALQIASGKTTPTDNDLKKLDVAPYINGKSSPNGKIDTGDVVVVLSKLVGKL